MSFDISTVMTALGEEAVAKAGDQVGLNREQSVRVARALAARAGMGDQDMVRAVAADTGLDEEVVAAMLKKLCEEGAKKLMEDTGVNAAIEQAKQEAIRSAGGMLGRMFGRK